MMAHIVKIGSLTDELINFLTGSSVKNEPTKFNTYHESALRLLRSNNYARTNQFEVQHQLDGLEEKFRIYNEDGLADALRQRLDELAKKSYKWAPEILRLFLELSDRPVINSKLDSLNLLKPPLEPAEPCYKWEEFATEDPPLRDTLVWQNIDYGAESSDDEGLPLDSDLEASSLAEGTAISIIDNEYLSRTNDLLSADIAHLNVLEETQFWRSKYDANMADYRLVGDNTSITFITELQTIREILFMLSGLPTSLFTAGLKDIIPISATDDFTRSKTSELPSSTAKGESAKSLLTPAPGYALRHVSYPVFYGILTQAVEFGNSILALRTWVARRQSVPLLQSLQAEVMMRLRLFDGMMSNMQSRYVEPTQNLVISLVEMHANVMPLVRPLLRVSGIIKVLDLEPYAHSFRFLELLYGEACASQMAGDEDLYEYLGTLFFDCFRVYLRQIRQWMEEGELWKDDHAFFVSENVGDVELASLWLNRYKLRKTLSGTLHAPKFLHPATSKIFTAGKSVVVLKALEKHDRKKKSSLVEEPKLDFQTVCGSPSLSLAPFSELFDVAFDQWIKSKHHVTSSTLRTCLFDDCGLRDSLIALENIYFMTDGNITSQFANVLFERLDSGKSIRNDRLALTELVQGTIGSLPGVTSERLKVANCVMKRVDVQKPHKSVKALGALTLTYSLPWPVQIVITKDSIPSYQRIFTFLLQIRRSAYILQSFRLVHVSSGIQENTLYYSVRSRLLWFASTLYSYLTDLVIDPNAKQMHIALEEGDDVDQMKEAHRDHMKKLIDQALLGSELEPIHKIIIAILDLSIQLSDARTMQTTSQRAGGGSVASVQDISSHRPMIPDTRARQQGPGRKRYSDSSDEDSCESETDPGTILAMKMELTYTDQLRRILSHFDGLCKFVITGLRGVARAGGEPNWDMLADKLGSGLA